MRERDLEKALGSTCAKYDVPCLKFQPDNRTGMPDRIIILPEGAVWWVEMKTTGGELSEMQKFQHAWLRVHGHKVFVLWSKEDIEQFDSKLYARVRA